MSLLQKPRLNFTGTFQADVFTANNDDIAIADSTLPFVDSANVRIDTKGMTDNEFQQWLIGVEPGFGVRGGWNVFGTGRCRFAGASVTAAELATGDLVADNATEPMVGATVELRRAVMVDLDPEGTQGTQIFCDRFAIQKGDLQIIGPPNRFVSRWVARRNLAIGGFGGFGCVWYATILPEQVEVVGDSPVLESFRDATTAGYGLFVRFACYGLQPVMPPTTYQAMLDAGLQHQNPAVGRVTGCVGVWCPHTMRTIACGRRLETADSLTIDHTMIRLNPVIAAVDEVNQRIVLDMIHAVPELNESMAKVDLGVLHLKVEVDDPSGIRTEDLGTIDYSKTQYELSGGVVEFAFDGARQEDLRSGRLLLIQQSTGARLLRERDLIVETDDRCVYLQQSQTQTITLRLYDKGRPPGHIVDVSLVQVITSNRTAAVTPPATPIISIPQSVTATADGIAEFSVTGLLPGTCLLAFDLQSGDADSLRFFCNVRVFPEDNYDHIATADLTFDFIYQEVLQYFYLIYPAMAKIFRLDDEAAVSGLHEIIRERIAADRWNDSQYMPVSRDLSDGKRKLLTRYLQPDITESRFV